MSTHTSPSRHSDVDEMFEQKFTAEISQQMRVPKHIRAHGPTEYSAMDNHWISPMDLQEKFDMHVPDRILVAGQEQHIGTKAPPRELQLEKSVMPTDPGFVRVQTPPRVISLDEHYIPGADEMNGNDYVEAKPTAKNNMKPFLLEDGGFRPSVSNATPPNNISMNSSWREQLAGTSQGDEVILLRKQVVNLSRRVFRMEGLVSEMAQREKALFGLCVTYAIIKTLMWLRSS